MKRAFGGSFTLPLLLSIGCSTNSGSTPPEGGGSNTSYGGSHTGSNSNLGGGYHIDNVGGSTSKSSSTGPLNPDAGCAADMKEAEKTQVNIVILLDKSGSMGDQKDSSGGFQWQNCESRWNLVADTLKSFFSDPDSARLYASLSFLPADGDEYGMCTVSNYTKEGGPAIKVGMTQLNDTGRQKFINKLCDCGGDITPASGCIVPSGGTPTLSAIQGTLAYADKVRGTYPLAKTVIVFLTDGEPGFGFKYNDEVKAVYSCDDLPPKGCTGAACGCVETGDCISSAEEVQKVAAVIQSAPKESIYVAGVGDISAETLQTWAEASGNAAINLLDMSSAEAATTLRTRLESIRKTSIACEFKLPTPTNGSSIDPDLTNVVYTSGDNKSSDLYRTYDGTSASCGNATNSWYFDNPTLPTKITLCTKTCDALQPDPNGKVAVVYGCKIHVQIN
jgi:hypothetical protein